MLAHSTEERLALLLSVLGDEASRAAFKSMHPTRAKYVQQLLEEFNADPPSRDEVDYVVQDFNNYFSFALDTLAPQIASESESADQADAAGAQPKIRYFQPIEATGDVAADLNRLDPYQIATALSDDHPKTVALVLSKLETPHAAAVLETMSEEVRTDAVIFLSQGSEVPEKIVHQVMLSVFDKANSVTQCEEEVDQAKILAELMRSLPKDMRNQLIERLGEEDPELIASVRAQLYVFEDLLRLDDRDVQKVLAEIETDNLIVALQHAAPELVKKLLNNLSKRARQTIEEEMEYKSGVAQEEIDEARQKLVNTVGKLDESGDVTLH